MTKLARASAHSAASPAAFFARWVDHATWSQWSPDTTWVTLEGPVAVGARGVLKPAGGPKVSFVVSECEPDRVYTDVSRLPGARLTFRHRATPAATGTRLDVEVDLDGPLAWLWARTACRGFAASAAADLDRLVRLVEGAATAGAPVEGDRRPAG